MRLRERKGIRPGVALAAACALVCGPAAGSASAIDVSLGDSYASGEGAGMFDAGTATEGGNGCERSANAWPRLIGVPATAHFACDGATVRSLTVPQKDGALAGPDAVSQIDRLRLLAAAERVDRVYVTIGINDLGFGPILAGCVQKVCLRSLQSVMLPALHQVIGPGVTDDLRRVIAAAPGAQVVLVGYPNLIARGSTQKACGWLDRGERQRMRLLGRHLSATLAYATKQVDAGYVDTRGIFTGHELCSRETWVTPLATRDPHNRYGWRIETHGDHPNLRGQIGIALAVRQVFPKVGPVAPPA
jgi:GDSL-like lipase/acylhydrolase family protein